MAREITIFVTNISPVNGEFIGYVATINSMQDVFDATSTHFPSFVGRIPIMYYKSKLF